MTSSAQYEAWLSEGSYWSFDEYCRLQQEQQEAHAQTLASLSETSRAFLQAFHLPTLHPFCTHFANASAYYQDDIIPKQGPLLHHDYLETIWDRLATAMAFSVPSLWAMSELWLRFFAIGLAPLGCVLLLLSSEFQWIQPHHFARKYNTNKQQQQQQQQQSTFTWFLSIVSVLTVASSVVLLTDTLYVMEFGPQLGATFMTLSTILAFGACHNYNLNWTQRILQAICFLAAWLVIHQHDDSTSTLLSPHVHFGEPAEHVTIEEGLYYNSHNPLLKHTIEHSWSPQHYTYDTSVATLWMPTGDARTGLPFLLNHIPQGDNLVWYRLWLPVDQNEQDPDDFEVIALDIHFPNHDGFDPSKPVYMILHGINGGTHEKFIQDFATRADETQNATTIVMMARGLQDLPVRGWHNFHGARWSDAHAASRVIRHALQSVHATSVLVGVGFSMGAIILNNLVGRVGTDCALDAAVSLSGGLDMRFQKDYWRAKRLFEPIITVALRGVFMLGKWGERIRARLSLKQMKALMQGTHITDVDTHGVVNYNGFDNVDHYYSEMSLLGDVPLDEYKNKQKKESILSSDRRVHSVAIPTLVVHALDDPLITWRSIVANEGPRHPSHLVQTGSGNLMVLLTRRGGHVGWSTGVGENWKWMNTVPLSFAAALDESQKALSEMEEQKEDEVIHEEEETATENDIIINDDQ